MFCLDVCATCSSQHEITTHDDMLPAVIEVTMSSNMRVLGTLLARLENVFFMFYAISDPLQHECSDAR